MTRKADRVPPTMPQRGFSPFPMGWTRDDLPANDDGTRCRQEVRISGHTVRIYETYRRQCGSTMKSLPDALLSGRQQQVSSDPGVGNDRNASPGRAELSNPEKPRRQRSNRGARIHQMHPSNPELETITSRVDHSSWWHIEPLLSPPPTPRIQRLPTPELPAPKGKMFCDSCSHSSVDSGCGSCHDHSRVYGRLGHS